MKIDHLATYKTLIQENKKRLGSVASNCILMSADIDRYIVSGRLYADTFEDGIIVLIDEFSYFNLYYFWKPGASLPDLRQEKPVVIEEVNNRGSRDAYLESFEPRLLEAGFVRERCNVQVEADFTGREDEIRREYQVRLDALAQTGLKATPCTDENTFKQVLALWQTHLDTLDIPAEHLHADQNNQILNLTNPDGFVAATYWWRHNRRTSEGRHLVTHPDYYRKGLGYTLLLAWVLDALDHGVTRWLTWINDENVRSLSLCCNKLGFSPNGRTCRQYLLNPRQ